MRVLAMFTIVSLVLASCGKESGDNREDRQFANDPTKPAQATDVVSPTLVPDPTTEPTSLPSPESLVDSRGGATYTYALMNGSIIQIDPSKVDQPPRRIVPEKGSQFVALDSSTSGSRVAALSRTGDGTLSLIVFDSDGAQKSKWKTSLRASGIEEGTPDSGSQPVADNAFIDWGGDGSSLLVGTSTQLESFTLEGKSTAIPLARSAGKLDHASWSPTGDNIAMLLERDGAKIVAVVKPGEDEARPRQVVPTGASAESVSAFAWVPNGSGIIYLQSSDNGNQLYLFNLDGGGSTVVATPGQGGPSATIGRFSVSPDGRSVAYAIAIIDNGQQRFHSLWIRSLRTGQTYRLSTGMPDEVNALWWTKEGLLWGQLDGRDDNQLVETFVQVSPGQQPLPITRISINATVDGTPVATPQATPAAQVYPAVRLVTIG